MYLVVRKDVALGRGEAMAQAGHAALECVHEHGDAGPAAFAAFPPAAEPGAELRRLEVLP